jgi:hypothetical protein
MSGTDALFFAGIACLVVAVFMIIGAALVGMVRNSRDLKEMVNEGRRIYQGRIRGMIYFMIDIPDVAEATDAEWQLQSLLYEYRQL